MFAPTATRLAAASFRTSIRRASTSKGASGSAAAAAAVRTTRERLPPLESYNEVPEYYVERGEALKSEDADATNALKTASLMNDLSAATLLDSSGFKAQLTIREGKVPTEIITSEGDVVHPSGFVVPTPQALEDLPLAETRMRDASVETAGVADRVKEEGLLVEVVGSGDTLASTQRLAGKVPFEVDVDGSGEVEHPSGFKPPAPEGTFAEGFHSETRPSRRDDA